MREPDPRGQVYAVSLMKVPVAQVGTACCSSACVFITIGPYQATGSLIGLPEIEQEADAFVARLHGDLVAAVEQHQRPVAGLLADEHLLLPSASLFSVSTPNGSRGVAERAGALEHIGEGVAAWSRPAGSSCLPGGTQMSR